ncbi:MAG: hypothetical protein MJ211_15870, partial [Bacteroidales bacterium]|nr:hypothetical protein [Bacteroidales bacterium]
IRNISADGNFAQLETKQICAVDFRVSKYNSLKEKVDDIGLDGVIKLMGTDFYIKYFEYPFTNIDFFDVYEQQVYGETDKLVSLDADLENTNWYKSSIYNGMYHNYKETEVKRERPFSYPPSDAMTIFNPLSINHDYLTDTEINTGIAKGIYEHGMFTYNVIYHCHEDLKVLRDKIAKKRDNGQTLTEYEKQVLKYQNPESLTKGNYPYTISYRLPGKNKITSTINKIFIYK